MSLRAKRKIPWGVDSGRSEARLRLLNPLNLETTDVARSPFRRTDRYPHAFGAIFVSLELSRSNVAGDVAVAGQRREDVQAQLTAGDVAGLDEAVCGAQAQGGDPDRPELSDHHDPGGGAGRVLAAPCSARQKGIESHVVDAGFDRGAAAAHGGPRRTGSTARRCCGRCSPTSAASRGSARWWSAPSPEEEDAAQVCRERQALIAERITHVNRIKGLSVLARASATTSRCGAIGGRGSRRCARATGGSCRRI